MSTAALRSKRMIDPSARRISLAVRTTIAFITLPFLTRPRGIASFTDTTITSPTVAYLRLEPPSTLMHWTRRAPELSATSRLVCIWIIGPSLLRRRLGGLDLAGAAPRRGLLLDGGLGLVGDRARRRRLGRQHHEALVLRDRPALLDAHEIAHFEGVLLIMRRIFLGAHDVLL